MRIFDPHIHMSSRTTDDYERMHAAGVRALVEPAFWLGQPRTSVGSFTDYFDALVGWERFRAAQFGITHHCTIALNPKEANDPRCAGVLDVLPRYLAKDGVVAVGEIGFDSMSSAEEQAFRRQLDLAVEFELPAMVHTPHRDKEGGTRRTLELVEESGIDPGMVVVDHLNELTVGAGATSRVAGWASPSTPTPRWIRSAWCGSSQERGTERVLVNSAADWGRSDPLLTRATGGGDARRRIHRRRRRPGAVAQPGGVLRRRAGGSCCPSRTARLSPHASATLRGQLDPARAAGHLMRLRHRDGTVVHLGYGTNVLPAEDVDGLVAQAAAMGDRIRTGPRRRRPSSGLGLWLPARCRPPSGARTPTAYAASGAGWPSTASRW